MDVNNQNLSLLLFSYLCKVVGSEDVVRTRRRTCNVLDYVNHQNKFSYICSGSKAEGLDLDGSDFDLMIVKNLCPVYENIEDRIINKKRNEEVSLIMDANVTKPGYTRLKMYSDFSTDLDLIHYCYNIGYDTFLSSKEFRDTGITSDKIFTHGPCKSDVWGYVDIVQSLQCQKWIVQADSWIHRSRSSWPHNRLIENIVQYGVLFVPIGCKKSPYEDFEFRISFNYAEKKLVNSFSHVQLLCYALLKVILNHFIKPKYGDLLCSYFLKTIMFWVSEETEESIWQPQNLLRCFDRCFKRLVYCVTYSTCLHYFIPELDFFEDRFSKSEHASLTSILQSLYKSGWQCVLQTNLFSSFKLPARIVHSVSALQIVGFTNMLIRHVFNDVTVLKIVRSMFGSLHLAEKQIYAIALSQAMQWAAQVIHINGTNKQRYRSYRNCLSHLLQGIHHDAVSGWLLLASCFYTCKQYQQCLDVINYCLHICTSDKILLTSFIDTKLQHEFNIEMQHVKNGFLRTCKRRVVDSFIFTKQSSIIPAELSSVVVDEHIEFPPLVFAYFLRCICLHHLNRKRDKMNALRDLGTTLREMYFIPNTEYHRQISNRVISVANQL